MNEMPPNRTQAASEGLVALGKLLILAGVLVFLLIVLYGLVFG